MNITDRVNIRGALDVEVLRILRAVPGLTVEVAPADGRADAVLRAAGTTTPLAVEVKRRMNAGTARLLVERMDDEKGALAPLVVAHETTADARRILREAGISVVDDDGNAHIELPGVVVHVDVGPRADTKQRSPARLSGKAGLVAQVLLHNRARAWKVNNLAEQAGVSVGLAHRVLDRLEAEEIVHAEGAGPARFRLLDNPAALLDLWAEEQNDHPVRTRAFLLAQTTRRAIDTLGAGLDRAGVDYALTGAAGASLVAPFVTAVPVVDAWIAATAAPDHVCQDIGAEPVKDGHNVVFLQAKTDGPLTMREQHEGRWVANPFRLYLDLLREPQRGREQAEHLRREVIGF